MKMQLIVLLSLLSLGAMAHEIQGTLMLKGTLKSKLMVDGVSTACKLRVEKVKNLLEEDAFGNPAFQARIQISLDGHDLERGIQVKSNKEYNVINLHKENGALKVKDFDYYSLEEKVTVTIDSEGRLTQASFPYKQKTITCNF